jgi:hypothetical protein
VHGSAFQSSSHGSLEYREETKEEEEEAGGFGIFICCDDVRHKRQ